MKPTRKTSVIPWLAFAGAVLSLAYGLLYPVHSGYRDGPADLSTPDWSWIWFTAILLAFATFASWKYRTLPAKLAFWILLLLGAVMTSQFVYRMALLGEFS